MTKTTKVRSKAQRQADIRYRQSNPARSPVVQVVVTPEEFEQLDRGRGELSMSSYARKKIFG